MIKKHIPENGAAAGVGVDARGDPARDPTTNVRELVDVEKEHYRELRATDLRHDKDLREADTRRQDDLREQGEGHRKELAEQKQSYDRQIGEILTVQVKTTSELISTQLEKVTNSLSTQFNNGMQQQSGLITTLSDRIGRLEQSKSELAGRSSVADPQLADALSRLSNGVSTLAAATNETMSKIAKTNEDAAAKMTASIATLKETGRETHGIGMGRAEVFGWLAGTVVAMGGVVTLIAKLT